ncbi:hypothetical protein HWV62_31323 [Athelia sp. TMB]|nr:hypothetical protein HWV62_25575 [Athelia sp. TMB]KAF7986503.1 hypothetical protein HWV62_31323 [Athelia sp. TMB]
MSPSQNAEHDVRVASSDESETGGHAPTESVNPLGYEVTLLSAVMLTVGQLLGAGMYSVPGSVLNSVGSIGIFLLYWLLGPLIAYCE